MSNLLLYSKTTKHPLLVTVETKKEWKQFKMSYARYKKLLKNYCNWYNSIVTSHCYTDYQDDIILSNGIKITAVLY